MGKSHSHKTLRSVFLGCCLVAVRKKFESQIVARNWVDDQREPIYMSFSPFYYTLMLFIPPIKNKPQNRRTHGYFYYFQKPITD